MSQCRIIQTRLWLRGTEPIDAKFRRQFRLVWQAVAGFDAARGDIALQSFDDDIANLLTWDCCQRGIPNRLQTTVAAARLSDNLTVSICGAGRRENRNVDLSPQGETLTELLYTAQTELDDDSAQPETHSP